MKYYYNGRLVRTSKHIYNYVLISEFGGCIAFSKNYKSLETQKNSEIKFLERQLAYYTKANKVDYIENYKRGIENTKKWHIEPIKGVE